MAEGLKPCKVCGHKVAESASNCPNCGANLEEPETPTNYIVRVIITLAVIIVLGRILYKVSNVLYH
jgi:RNA polymerase subunit RPABC4/transcription elongation factor Spt4